MTERGFSLFSLLTREEGSPSEKSEDGGEEYSGRSSRFVIIFRRLSPLSSSSLADRLILLCKKSAVLVLVSELFYLSVNGHTKRTFEPAKLLRQPHRTDRPIPILFFFCPLCYRVRPGGGFMYGSHLMRQ